MGYRRRERQTRVGSQAESHGGWLHPDSTGATGCICPHLRPGDWAFITCTPSHSWARVTLRHLLLSGKTGRADVGQEQTSDGSHWDRTVDRHTQTRGDWAVLALSTRTLPRVPAHSWHPYLVVLFPKHMASLPWSSPWVLESFLVHDIPATAIFS